MDRVKFWVAFSIGAAFGASIALLYAPMPGTKTRKVIREKAGDAGDYLAEQYDSASEYVKDQAADLTKQAAKAYGKTKSAAGSYSDDLVENLQQSAKNINR